MSATIDADDVEYVEYLEGDYEEDQETVTLDEESLQQVEYIEAQQLSGDVEYNEEGYPQLEGHTVFEHNGRQYMIPNELHQSGQTLVLEDYTGDGEEQFVLSQVDNAVEATDETTQINSSELNYIEYEDGTEQEEANEDHWGGAADEVVSDSSQMSDGAIGTSTGRQYAVLRDGKLHMEGSGNQDKLQELQQSLGLDDSESQQHDITGKNLITGQTISLSGFLEKIKKKSDVFSIKREPVDDSYYPESIKKQRRTFYNQGRQEKRLSDLARPDYVLLPPVNKKVLVGKTPDGKNIVGKILQIWKKIDNTIPPPKPRINRRKPLPKILKNDKPTEKVEELIIDSTGKIISKDELPPKNVVIKKKYVSKAFLDENIVKTLSGLMELESIQRNLSQKNLIIKHILKKSVEGKILPGKDITYYYGHMEKSDVVDCFNEIKTKWTFISDYRENPSEGGIDLNVTDDRHQVDLSADGKVTFGSLTDPDLTEICSGVDGEVKRKKVSEFTSTVPVNLIVIEDEYGKKRTKVTIPQLTGQKSQNRRPTNEDSNQAEHFCSICTRSCSSASSLHRHMSSHSPSEELLSPGPTQGGSNRRYACATCGKQFNRHSNMLRHADIHRQQPGTEEQDGYTCDICGCHYNFISSLTRHIVNKHMYAVNENETEDAGQEPFELVPIADEAEQEAE